MLCCVCARARVRVCARAHAHEHVCGRTKQADTSSATAEIRATAQLRKALKPERAQVPMRTSQHSPTLANTRERENARPAEGVQKKKKEIYFTNETTKNGGGRSKQRIKKRKPAERVAFGALSVQRRAPRSNVKKGSYRAEALQLPRPDPFRSVGFSFVQFSRLWFRLVLFGCVWFRLERYTGSHQARQLPHSSTPTSARHITTPPASSPPQHAQQLPCPTPLPYNRALLPCPTTLPYYQRSRTSLFTIA